MPSAAAGRWPAAVMLALRLAWREFRAGEWSILLAALIVAVASSTAVSLIGDRLSRTMIQRAAEFLAADMVLAGHDPIPQDWLEKAREIGLRTAETLEFSNVVMAADAIQLVGVKAVSDAYPLRGELMTTIDRYISERPAGTIPSPGTAWVEQRVLGALGLQLGDTVEIGDGRFRVERIVTREPDPRGDLYSLAPRVLVNLRDVPATHVLQPGSHVHRYYLFAGHERVVRAFKQWVKPQLHPGQRVLDVHEDRPQVGNALKRAERYLGLTTVAVVLIAGCAIAMSVRRYTERHFDLSAVLKCLGMDSRSVTWLYLIQFIVIGSVGSLIGILLGWGLQEVGVRLLRDALPARLSAPGLSAGALGVLSGLSILIGFGLGPLLRLHRCPALRILRRDLTPPTTSAWVVYGFAALLLAVLIWRHTGDARLSATLLVGGSVAVALLAGSTWLALSAIGRLAEHAGPRLRFPLRALTHSPGQTVGQTLAFGLTLVAMLLTLLVRGELVTVWQRQLPRDAPNHFALNLFENDRQGFVEFLGREQIPVSDVYPIVRGRLTAINGSDVWTRVSRNSTTEASIDRDLSLTWSARLPAENTIVGGQWWDVSLPNTAPVVSVEGQLAENLGLRIGDRLTFNVAGVEVHATVSSLRRVRWDSMRPNFFMIFPPGVLDSHPHTYLSSMYIEPGRKDVLNRLVKAFPAISLLEVDRLISQVQSMLSQLSAAVEFVLLAALLAGFTLMFAAVRASLDLRLLQNAVLRTLGASARLLRVSLWAEFCLLGFFAGLLAAGIAEGLTALLFVFVFDLTPGVHPWFWILTPPLAALLIGAAGYFNTRRVLRDTPVSVLRGV